MTGYNEAGPNGTGPAATPPTVTASTALDKPSVNVPRATLARWCEMAEAALDNPPECIDILCDLAASIEDAWLAPEAAA